MSTIRLSQEFYAQSALTLAPNLIGKLLCRSQNGNTIKLRITETESYCGEEDTACHAHKGKTQRTAPMYEQGGISYIYLCYGIHSLLNIVAGAEGSAEAVLIRGVEGYNGPGKLTKAMNITKTLNQISLLSSTELWLEDDKTKPSYTTAKRVGIDYATDEYRNKLWRFISK